MKKSIFRFGLCLYVAFAFGGVEFADSLLCVGIIAGVFCAAAEGILNSCSNYLWDAYDRSPSNIRWFLLRLVCL